MTTWTRRPDGYYHAQIGGVWWYRHRWVWTQAYGPIPPKHVIDHKDETPGNDWIENLQCITHAENLQLGSTKLAAHNTSGFNCVYLERATGRWYGQFQLRGKAVCCGTFETPEQANEAVLARRKELNAPTRRVAAPGQAAGRRDDDEGAAP